MRSTSARRMRLWTHVESGLHRSPWSSLCSSEPSGYTNHTVASGCQELADKHLQRRENVGTAARSRTPETRETSEERRKNVGKTLEWIPTVLGQEPPSTRR
eukprot:gene14142-biopygen5320